MKTQHIGFLSLSLVLFPPKQPCSRIGLAVTAAILIAIASTSEAEDRFVQPGGVNQGNDCRDELNPCRSIARAVDQAVDNDRIILKQGGGQITRFPVSNLVLTESLTFLGEGTSPNTTILDAGGNSRHFTITPGLRVVFNNLTMMRGQAQQAQSDGGAILKQGPDGELVLNRVIFNENGADGNGGAIAMEGALLVVASEFDDNLARGMASGANGDGGAIHVRSGDAVIKRSTFTNNFAQTDGGAVNIEGGSLKVEETLLMDNSAISGSGGAISCIAAAAEQGAGCLSLEVILESNLERNFAEFLGGAIYTEAPSLIKDANFVENMTASNNNISHGGAVYANLALDDNAELTIRRTLFEENIAGEHGGGVVAQFGDVTITSSSFVQNRAGASGSGRGGAVHFNGADTASISDSLAVVNSTFSENVAATSAGAIWIESGSQHLLSSITAIDNQTTSAGSSLANVIEGKGRMNRAMILANAPICGDQVGFDGENNLIREFDALGAETVSSDCGSVNGFHVVNGMIGTLNFGHFFGGRTPTYEIESSSGASSSGGDCGNVSIDQNGVNRENPCDVGSFEILGVQTSQ